MNDDLDLDTDRTLETARPTPQAEEVRLIIEGVKDHAISMLDREGRIVSWNSGAERIKGYALAEVLGRHFRMLFLEEDREAGLPERELAIAEAEGTFEGEGHRLCKDGSTFYAAVSMSALRGPDGRLEGFVRATYDMTEPRRLREELRGALEAEQEARVRVERLQAVTAKLSQAATPRDVAAVLMLEGIDALSADEGFVVLASRDSAAHVVVGHRGMPDEVIAAFRAPPRDARTAVAETLRSGRPMFVESLSEHLREFPDSDRWLARRPTRAFAVLPLLGRAAPPLGAVVIGFHRSRLFSAADRSFAISLSALSAQALERASLLERERAAKVDAEVASRLKDDFLATVSHELRTPLNAVLGWASLLAGRTPEPPLLAKGLDAIARNARAQAKLVEDLLDVSRIVSGKLVLKIRRTDAVDVARRAIDAVKPMADARRITVELVADADSVVVPADGDRLQQIVWHLVTNAVKFSPAGDDRRVRVSVERRDDDVAIVVADQGHGILPEFLPHLFEPFKQADQSTTRKFGGLGLGLAIVRHLVELHGGTVRAESDGEGKGATITVLLASASTATWDTEPPPEPRSSVRPGRLAPELRGVRVLVVDDEPDARDVLCASLEPRGATVRAVGSAAEALDALAEFRPDILVSDIAMPGTDGYDLIRAVRAHPHHRGVRLPAIALTAHARPADRQRALDAGYQLHMTKPASPEDLVAAIATLTAPIQSVRTA